MTIILPPKPVGAYCMGDGGTTIAFQLDREPSRWHRWWTRFFLGWRWSSYQHEGAQE